MTMRELMGGLGEYYPGSRERRQANPVPDEVPDAPELGEPIILEVAGFDVEFWEIGTLAAVLNRRAGTIRSWENEGTLPPSGWWKPSKVKDPRGRRRIWTRDQIVGVWRIAREEGVLDPGPHVNIARTQFTARVKALFEDLKKKGFR